MKLTRRKIYVVIALSVTALLGIAVVQYFWVTTAFENEKTKFYSEAKLIGLQIQETIQSDSTLKKGLIDLSTSTNPDPQKVQLYKNRLSKLADSLFAAKNNDIVYEFGLVTHDSKNNDCCHRQAKGHEEVVFSTMSKENDQKILDTIYRICACPLDRKAHIDFYYPNINTFLLAKIADLIVLSLLCILIVGGCIGFAFKTIRKQKKLAEMKNNFINNMTHEFKTPIFSISLASKALGNAKEIQESEKLKKYINLISDENDRLKSQVEKVLQMALIGSENPNLDKEQVDLHELIKQAVSKFELQIAERGGSINLQLDASKHIIHADQTHIINIINNLIDNAIKYSKEKPQITVRTSDKEKGISFSVNDNGIGMDSETKEHIFDKFYRAQTGDIHDDKGFGLGLTYVKNIVEAHEGWIKLKSKLNKGSTFTIFLPA